MRTGEGDREPTASQSIVCRIDRDAERPEREIDTMANKEDRDLRERLMSLDAYRGFTMLAMASGGLGIAHLASSHPDSRFWNIVEYQAEHVPWVGCSVWDLIQPSFMFMVGVAMAYSCAARWERGQSYARMLAHAVFPRDCSDPARRFSAVEWP